MKILSTLSVDKQRRAPAIDRTLLEPIGELTVAFAMLEGAVKSGIRLLLFPDGDGGWEYATCDIVTSPISFRRLVDLFQALVTHRCSDTDVDECNALCKELYRLEDRRNAIIHSHWAIDGTSRATVRLKTTAKGKKGLNYHEELMTRADIVNIVDELCSLTKRLGDFIEPEQAKA
jgi:hypothetical protein